jgi:hypothetical protein
MRLAPSYNRRLQGFDALLRMRWSAARECWVLERKYRRASWSINTATLTDDAAIQLRDGFMELSTYPARGLPHIERLIQYLGRMDTWRHGYSPEGFADTYEQHHEVQAEAKERHIQRHLKDRASDTYDEVVAMNGSRSFPRHTGFR